MTITQAMAKLLGGSISVKSTPGEGSTFTVKIPLVEVETTDLRKKDIPWDEYHFSQDTIILVVEDDFANREMIKTLFQELGIKINLAENGKQGIEKTLRLKPDLVLMDIHMPGMNGLEATQQIRNIPECKHIPIVALSADAYKEQQKEALHVGITDYLSKPLQVNQLLRVLKKYLR
ncbi:response regulator [Deltaproteobacteria bacterium TL4]